jgi:hypothetical protein
MHLFFECYSLPVLLKKFEQLGYDKEALHSTLRYIRNVAPIIIHFRADSVLHLLLRDTHYRYILSLFFSCFCCFYKLKPTLCLYLCLSCCCYCYCYCFFRNQFETHTSGGSLSAPMRINWEDRLFGEYYHSATPFERVKYGVLNMVNDPNGVAACRGCYGDSYLLLRDVRLRCTLTSKDSSSPDAVPSTGKKKKKRI